MSDKVRKYACILINIPARAAEAMQRVQQHIAKDDLFTNEADNGLEDHYHVTVLYGLEDRYKTAVCKALSSLKPFALQFGNISTFDTNPKFDVLKFDITDCPVLHQIHQTIKDLFPNDYKYDEYVPHATLSYNKPGTAKKYIKVPNDVTGRTIIVRHLIWSDTNSNKYLINLDR